MTSSLLTAFEFLYPSPNGRDVSIYAARMPNGDHVFTFLEIAQALLYETASKMSPSCSTHDIRQHRFANFRHARKCVTRDGLLHCTPRSRVGALDGTALSPATHFHAWLEQVVLPVVDEFDHFPPTADEVRDLQLAYLTSERDKLSIRIEGMRNTIAREGLEKVTTAVTPTPSPTSGFLKVPLNIDVTSMFVVTEKGILPQPSNADCKPVPASMQKNMHRVDASSAPTIDDIPAWL